jgi:hypothetical protein
VQTGPAGGQRSGRAQSAGSAHTWEEEDEDEEGDDRNEAQRLKRSQADSAGMPGLLHLEPHAAPHEQRARAHAHPGPGVPCRRATASPSSLSAEDDAELRRIGSLYTHAPVMPPRVARSHSGRSLP